MISFRTPRSEFCVGKMSLLLRKWDWRKRSPSPRPSPPGEGEARTVPGIFAPFGVELLHGDSRRRLRPGLTQEPHHGVAVPEHFRFCPNVRHVQRVAPGMAEDEQTASREQGRKIRIVQQLLREGGGTAPDVFFAVRRVGEN